MNIWNNINLAKALNIEILDGFISDRVEFNSLDINPGELFIALPGANSDGHSYVRDAISKGAAAAIVSRPVNGVDSSKIIQVADTMQALRQMAEYKRKNSKAIFIGITGSVGKTSTKEALGIALEPYGKVFVSRKNFNNDLGVLINLASMNDDVDFAVIEMGMNNIGEISYLSKQIIPHISIITNIGSSHIEHLGSRENIAKAKCEILDGMNEYGKIIINGDSEFKDLIVKYIQKSKVKEIYKFGEKQDNGAILVNCKNNGLNMTSIFNIMNQEYSVDSIVTGKHQALNMLSAILVLKLLNLDVNLGLSNLSKLQTDKERGGLHHIILNDNNITIINDAYNAANLSIEAALNNILTMQGMRKIAVLSDMYELGKYAQEMHEALAPFACKMDILITIGPLMKHLYNKVEMTKKYHYENLQVFEQNFASHIMNGDIILFKGSNGTKLRKFVEKLTQTQL